MLPTRMYWWTDIMIVMWSMYFLVFVTFLPVSLGFTFIHPVATIQQRCHTRSLFRPPSIRHHSCFRAFEQIQILQAVSSSNDLPERGIDMIDDNNINNSPEQDDDDDDDDVNVDIDTADDKDIMTQQSAGTTIRRRRRRRKGDDNIETTKNSPTAVVVVVAATPTSNDVTIPIVDVRSLVGGDVTTTTTTTANRDVVVKDAKPQLNKDRGSNRIIDDRVDSSSDTTTSTTTYDPLEQLLIDVKEMRSRNSDSPNGNEIQTGSNNNNNNNNNEGSVLPAMSISRVISTIVIVDFFIVLVFFLWFILGIVASYTIKNDAIQIAFNSNFQTLVQPALGILMIASISDAVFKEKEE